MASLRRRTQLAPLDDLPGNSTNDETTFFDDQEDPSFELPADGGFDHYVSPCEFRVSNDPLVVSDQDTCDATIYGCVRDHKFLISADDKVLEMDLTYEYDLYYEFVSTMHNYRSMLEFLEGAMLEHLASLLEIKQCPPGSSTSRGSGQRGLSIPRGRSLMEFTEEQKALFVAINSDPVDAKSETLGKASRRGQRIDGP